MEAERYGILHTKVIVEIFRLQWHFAAFFSIKFKTVKLFGQPQGATCVQTEVY
jgi:hypothetical protein